MSEMKNVDGLLLSKASESVESPEPAQVEEEEAPSQNVVSKMEEEPAQSDSSDYEEEEPTEKEDKKTDVDDYGNSLAKERTYSESEVQNMIRDRLSRGQAANYQQQEQQQQQAKEVAKDFNYDQNSNENWEQQLEDFIDKKIAKNRDKEQREHWENSEKTKQAEFESKFSTGMQRYKDFNQIVLGKPLTNSMMLATRNMKDPAAFVYAASKTQAKELERISQLQDPYQQAAEIGKLEERMRKNRGTVSNSPRPLDRSKGDMVGKGNDRPNIDTLINQHAKKKLKRN